MTITINGSGTITGVTPGGLPDGSVTQSELATGVAGTGPAFSAYISANQTVTSAAITLAQFDTETIDTASCYNNTNATVGGIPAYAFLPSVAGYYQVTVALGGAGSTSCTYVGAQIYKNGTSISRNITPSYSNTNADTVTTRLVFLNGTTDYIQAYGQSAGTGTMLFTGQINDTRSVFSACLVRGV